LSKVDDKATLPLRRAVANLLRLASWNVKDAELLLVGRNPENAPLLIATAVHRLMEAVAGTEHGWPVAAKDNDLDQIPDDNALKPGLARIVKLAQPPKPLALLPDGTIPPTFDRETFRQDVTAVKKLLHDCVERFGVDLLGDGPAERAAPVRPQAAPKPEPPKQRPKPQPEATPSKAQQDHPRVSGAKPPKDNKPHPAVSIPDARAPRPVEAERRAVEGRSPMEVALTGASLTSTAFWALMDQWNVPDLAALQMIGHAGGLSKKGTRPRFKLLGEEADMVRRLVEIDEALSALELDPEDWLNKPVKAPPFKGATVLDYLTHNGLEGARETSRYILKNGLKLSVSGAP
jgi:hypothetical protein